MNNQHPITPPPDEMVQQWYNECPEANEDSLPYVSTQAARWGADQELLACGKYLEHCAQWEPEDVTELYNYRRPKPPSLKEQALAELEKVDMLWDTSEFGADTLSALDTIRRALEALPE